MCIRDRRWDEERTFVDGALEVHVPAPGEYAVEWRLAITRGHAELDPGPPLSLVVRDTDEPQEFELAVSADAVRAALGLP